MSQLTSERRSDMLHTKFDGRIVEVNNLHTREKQMKVQLVQNPNRSIKMTQNTPERKRDISIITTNLKQINKKMSATKRINSSGESRVGPLPGLGVVAQKTKAVHRIPNPFAKDVVPQYLWNIYASPYVKKRTMGKKMMVIAQHQNVTIRSLPDMVHVNDSLNIIKRREQKINDRRKKLSWGVNSSRSHEFKAEKIKTNRWKFEKVSLELESSEPAPKSILKRKIPDGNEFDFTIESISNAVDKSKDRRLLIFKTCPVVYTYENMQYVPTVYQSFMSMGHKKMRLNSMKDNENDEAFSLRIENVLARFTTRVKRVIATRESSKPIVFGTGYNVKKYPDALLQSGINPNHTNYGRSQLKRVRPEKAVTTIQRKWRRNFKKMHTFKVTAHLETKVPGISGLLDTGVRLGMTYDCLKPLLEKAMIDRDWLSFIKSIIYGVMIWKHGEPEMMSMGLDALISIKTYLEDLASSTYQNYLSKMSPRLLYNKLTGKLTTTFDDGGKEITMTGIQNLDSDVTVIEGLTMEERIKRDADTGEIVSTDFLIPKPQHTVACTCHEGIACEGCILQLPTKCVCHAVEKVDATSESLSDAFQFLKTLVPKFMAYIGGIFNTSLYQKLLQVVTSGFLVKFFSMMGYGSIGDMMSTFIQTLDFAKFSFETFIGLITSGWDFIYGLITGDHKVHIPPDAKWITEVDEMLGYTSTVAKIGTWKPDLPHSERLRLMLIEIARLEKEGLLFLQSTNSSSKIQFATRVAQLRHASSVVDKQLGTIRYIPAPFPIHLVGGAGMGKTASQSIICAAVAPVFGATPTDTYIMPLSDFQSGYGGQKIVVFDDLNQLKDAQSNNAINNIWININSNNKTMANMADLPDKGKVYFNASVVIATSNIPDAGSQNMYVYPLAGMRRLAHVVHFDIVPYEGPHEEYQGKTVVQYTCFRRILQGPSDRQQVKNVDEYKTYCQYKMTRQLAIWAKEWKEEQAEFADRLNHPPSPDEIIETIQNGSEVIRIINYTRERKDGTIDVRELRARTRLQTTLDKGISLAQEYGEKFPAMCWYLPTHNFGTHFIMRHIANPIRHIYGLRPIADNEFETESHSYIFSVLVSPFIQQGTLYLAQLLAFTSFGVASYYVFPVTLALLSISEVANRGWRGLKGAIGMAVCSQFGLAGVLVQLFVDVSHACINFHQLTLPQIPQDNKKMSGLFGLVALFFMVSTVFTATQPLWKRVDAVDGVVDDVEEMVKKQVRRLLRKEEEVKPSEDDSAKTESSKYGDLPSDFVKKTALAIDDRISSKHFTNVEGAPTNAYQRQMISYMPNVGYSEDRFAKIRANIKYITWVDGSFSHGTLIGSMILTATHCIRENEEGLVQFKIMHAEESTEYILPKNMVKTFGEIAMINTTKVFPKSLNINYLAMLDGRQGHVEVAGKKTVFSKNHYIIESGSIYCDISYPDRKGPGSSGHPIIFYCASAIFIVGVHVGSGVDTGYGLLIKDTFLQHLRVARPLLDGGTVVSYDAKLSLDYNTQLAVNAVPEKSVVNYISDAQKQTLFPTMIPEGKISNSFGIEETRFIPTPLKEHLDNSQFSTLKYTPPTFKARVIERNGEPTWISPHLVNLAQIDQNVHFIRQDWIVHAVPTLAALLVKAAKFPLKPPITMKQCMNGIPGILNSVDLKTSAGSGYPGVKGEWVVGIHPNVLPNDKIMADLVSLLDVIDTGVFIRPVYRASLKDEVIKVEKNDQGKVRQFYGCNMPIQLLTRMLFAPMFIWMAQNRHQLPFKIGINATSPEWEQLYREFVFRGHYYESDIGSFDKKNSFQHIGIMLMIEIMFLYGYTAKQIARALLLGWSNVYFFLDVMGVILQMYACAPSGAPGTTYNNSCTVLFVLFMAYVMCVGLYKNIDFISALFTDEVRDFFVHVYICIYGDDLALAADSYSRKYFTGEVIYKVFQVFGFTLTKADKSPGIPEFHNDISKVTFLKRRFHLQRLTYTLDGETLTTEVVTAPLERSSIDKMLAFFEDKGGITMNEYLPIVIENAMKEEFLAGRQCYEERLMFLHSLPEDLKLMCKLDKIKTFEEMSQAYMNQTVDGSAFWVWV